MPSADPKRPKTSSQPNPLVNPMNTEPNLGSGSELPDSIRQRLASLAVEVQTIAAMLPVPPGRDLARSALDPSRLREPPDVVRVRRYLQMRRLRAELLPDCLFAEPAWDMLLDLYIAGLECRNISISSACIASAVPQTTALRWIRHLEVHGLVERHQDRTDGAPHLYFPHRKRDARDDPMGTRGLVMDLGQCPHTASISGFPGYVWNRATWALADVRIRSLPVRLACADPAFQW